MRWTGCTEVFSQPTVRPFAPCPATRPAVQGGQKWMLPTTTTATVGAERTTISISGTAAGATTIGEHGFRGRPGWPRAASKRSKIYRDFGRNDGLSGALRSDPTGR